MIPFAWINENPHSDFVEMRSFMIPDAAAEPLFAVMRVMERGITNEKPQGYFTCGSTFQDATTLTASLIFDLLRAMEAERVV